MDIFTIPILAAVDPISILIVAAGLGMVIFFHELGHFLVAKWCGVFVERFSIGFGRPILSKKWGETEYVLAWLPFGGYVKMLGQDDMDPGEMTDEDIAEDPRSYTAKNVPQRMAIISAGVIMNVLTAMVFFAIAFRSGIKTMDAEVGVVQVGMPAWNHGIRAGDRITAINGRAVKEFNDISRRTALSRGSMTMSGIHLNGDTFDVTIQPEKTEILRKIGVGPSGSLTILESMDLKKHPLALPGTPAAKVEFQPGDQISEVNGTAVANSREMRQIFNDHIDEPVEVTLTRTSSTEDGKKRSTEKVTLEPQKFHGFGFRVGMGEIRAVQDGSPAADAGFKDGDLIAKVQHDPEAEPLDVGVNIDPIRLTEYFSEHAGEELTVTVRRESEGTSPENIDIKITPEDRTPWSEPPLFPNSPLSIPSVGLAYQVVPRVFSVDPESAAEKAGIQNRDELKKIELIRKEGATVDGIKDDIKEIVIDDNNWAFAFWVMQEFGRDRDVKLTIRHDKAEADTVVELTPQEIDDWYLPTRGINFMPQLVEMKGENLTQSFAMGASYTVNSIEDIYLTLRGLFTRDISPKGLSGPIGIATIAYRFANMGLPHFLLFLGLISVNLAVINFLPIPPLDGGHMVFLMWEGIVRRKPNERFVITATIIGLLCVGSLMIFVIFMDIAGLRG